MTIGLRIGGTDKATDNLQKEEPTGYKEYFTIKYKNNRRGITNKDKDAERYAKSGWEVVSESIEPGKFKGGDACCLGVLCLPLALLAGSTEGYIVVTYGKR